MKNPQKLQEEKEVLKKLKIAFYYKDNNLWQKKNK